VSTIDIDHDAAEDYAPLWTAQDVADYLRCSPASLANMRSAGVGPKYVRIFGRSIRYRPEDVRQYVREVAA
jgi:hypothetical protein